MHFIPHYHFSIWEHNDNLLGDLTKADEGFCEKNFPNCEKHFLRTVTLPLWPDMMDEMVQKVIEVVIQTGKKYAN